MVRIKFAEDFSEQPAVIRVIGLGGAGGNAVNRMIDAGVSHVEFVVANTDSQALRRSLSPARVQLGEHMSKGLGVGGNPVLGRQAAEESRERLREVLSGADMVFITAGMGGGTGTGAASVVAQIARSLDPAPLIVATVTRPFEFEGLVRKNQADAGIKELRGLVDTLLTIPNERLFEIIDEKTTAMEAFHVADNVLRQAVQSITDVITRHGMVNVDYADVRNIMCGAGEALMGSGESTGRDRALQAAKRALESPLLENVSIDGAKGLLVNITGNKNVTMFEVRTAMDYIRGEASQEAHVFYGQVFDDSLEDRLQVTVIATGFPPLRPAARRMRGRDSLEKAPANPLPGGTEVLPDNDVRRPAYLRWKLRKLH